MKKHLQYNFNHIQSQNIGTLRTNAAIWYVLHSFTKSYSIRIHRLMDDIKRHKQALVSVCVIICLWGNINETVMSQWKYTSFHSKQIASLHSQQVCKYKGTSFVIWHIELTFPSTPNASEAFNIFFIIWKIC